MSERLTLTRFAALVGLTEPQLQELQARAGTGTRTVEEWALFASSALAATPSEPILPANFWDIAEIDLAPDPLQLEPTPPAPLNPAPQGLSDGPRVRLSTFARDASFTDEQRDLIARSAGAQPRTPESFAYLAAELFSGHNRYVREGVPAPLISELLGDVLPEMTLPQFARLQFLTGTEVERLRAYAGDEARTYARWLELAEVALSTNGNPWQPRFRLPIGTVDDHRDFFNLLFGEIYAATGGAGAAATRSEEILKESTALRDEAGRIISAGAQVIERDKQEVQALSEISASASRAAGEYSRQSKASADQAGSHASSARGWSDVAEAAGTDARDAALAASTSAAAAAASSDAAGQHATAAQQDALRASASFDQTLSLRDQAVTAAGAALDSERRAEGHATEAGSSAQAAERDALRAEAAYAGVQADTGAAAASAAAALDSERKAATAATAAGSAAEAAERSRLSATSAFEGASSAAGQAGDAAAQASDAAETAGAAAFNALTAADRAADGATDAGAAAGLADQAAGRAATSAQASADRATEAGTHAGQAAAGATAAEQSRLAAETAYSNAAGQRTLAESAAQAAATSSREASGYASSAGSAASAAEESRLGAAAQYDAALGAKGLAESAASAALESQRQASSSATSAGGAAEAAEASRIAASAAAQDSADARDLAAGSAGAALESERRAASSASDAGGSASASEQSRVAADAAYRDAAEAKRQAVLASGAAATHSSNASGYAGAAQTGAEAAQESRVAAEAAYESALDAQRLAEDGAREAASSAGAAATSASTASGHAGAAGSSASAAEDSRVAADAAYQGALGAKGQAAGSASAAAESASTAAGHATAAGTSAEAARLDRVDAEAARGAAQGSAQASAQSESRASSSATDAQRSAEASSKSALDAKADGDRAATGARLSEEASVRTTAVERGVIVLGGNPTFAQGATGYVHGGPDGAKNPQLRYTDADIEPHGNPEFAPSGRALSPVGHNDVLTERAFPVENGRVYRLRATTYCTTPAPGPFGETAAGMAYYGPDLLTTSTGGWQPTADYQLVQGHAVTDDSRRADFDLHVSRMPGFDLQIPDYAFAFRFFVAVNMGQPTGRTHISRMIVEDVTESYTAGLASEASRTSALNANASASAASGAAGQAAGSAGAAATSAGQAAESAGQASRSASAAITTAEQASGFASDAESWASTSFDYAQEAKSAGTKAGESAAAALRSAQSAQSYSGEAGQSAQAAKQSELNAATSAQNAGDAASASVTARGLAEASRDKAGEYAAAANEQRVAAQTAAGNASASQGLAATSATNAAGSASNAAGSASAALTSETNARGSASEASTSAGQASSSAGNAATSAQQASTFASNASGSASAAQGSASAADGSARQARAFMQAAVTGGAFRSLHRTDSADLTPGWRTEHVGGTRFRTLTFPDPNYDQAHVSGALIPNADRVPLTALSARIRVPSSVRNLELSALMHTDTGYMYARARTPDGQYVSENLPRDTWVTVVWDFQNHGEFINATLDQPIYRYRITVAAMDTVGPQEFDVQWIAGGRLDALPSASQADVDALADELHAEVTLRAQYERLPTPRGTLLHVQTFDFGSAPFQDQVRSYDLSYTVHPGWCVQFDVPAGGASDPYFTFPVPPVTIWDIGVVRVTLYWSGPTMESPVTLHWRTGSSGYRGDARMDARAGAPIRFEQGKWVEVEFHRDVHSLIPAADLTDTLRELRIDFQTGGLPPLNHFFVTRVDTFNLENAQPLATKAEFRAQADALAAEATIKVQRGNVIAGIGARADATGSAVGVQADRFFVDTGDGTTAYPFVVQGGRVQVNGDLIASGTVKATALSVGALDLVPNPSATGSLDGWDGTLTLGDISQSGVNIKAIYQRGTNDMQAQTRTFPIAPSQAYEFDVHLYTEQGGLSTSLRFFGLNVFDRYSNTSPVKVWNVHTRAFEPGHWLENNPYFWYGYTDGGTYRNMRGLLLPPGSDPAEMPFTGQNIDYVFVMDQTAHTARMRLYNLYNDDTPSWAVWMHPRAYLHAAASTTIDGRGLKTGTVTTDKLVVRGENRVDDPDMLRQDSWFGEERIYVSTSLGAPGLYAKNWQRRDMAENAYWAVREGDVYQVSVSVKARNSGTNAYDLAVGLWVQTPGGQDNWLTGQIVPAGTLSQDRWSRYVARIKIPPGYVRARFWMNQAAFDNFSSLAFSGVRVTMGDTLIDGDQITTGTIKAERLDLSGTLKVGADLNTLAGTLASSRVSGLDSVAQRVGTFEQKVFIPGTTEIDGGNIRTGTIQVGGNMLMNTGFRIQTAQDNPTPLGWKNLSMPNVWIVPSYEPWYRDPGTLSLRNTIPAGPNGWRHFRSDLIPVKRGVTYEYSLLAGAHRCDAQAYFDLYDAAGTNIANGAFTGISDTEGFDADNARAGSMKRLTTRYTVPDGVAFISLTFGVSGYKTGEDAYLFVAQPQVTIAPGGPQPALWSPGTVAIDGDQIRAGSIQAGHLAAQYLTVGTTVDQLGGTVKDSQITTISGNKITTGVITSGAKDSAGQPVSRLNLDDGSFRFGPSNGNRIEYAPGTGVRLVGRLVTTDVIDARVTNLVNDPNVSGQDVGWNGAFAYASGWNPQVRGLSQINTGDAMALSDWFPVNASRGYEFSVTLSMDGDASVGTRYFGLYVQDAAGNTLALKTYDSNGTFLGDDSNPYFWYSGGGADFLPLAGRLLPYGTDPRTVPASRNGERFFIMPRHAARARMRVLNYYNATTTRAWWLAPSVVEIGGAAALRGENIRAGTIDANVVNVTNLNASNITAGTMSAARITTGQLTAANGTSFLNLDAGTMRIGNPNGQFMAFDGTNLTLTGQIIQTANVAANAMTQIASGDGEVRLLSSQPAYLPNSNTLRFTMNVPSAAKMLLFVNLDTERISYARISAVSGKVATGTFVQAFTDPSRAEAGYPTGIKVLRGASNVVLDVAPGAITVDVSLNDIQAPQAGFAANTFMGTYSWFAIFFRR